MIEFCKIEINAKLASEFYPDSHARFFLQNNDAVIHMLENNTKELKGLINKSAAAYDYCFYIENDIEVRKHITDSHFAYKYWTHVEQYQGMLKYFSGDEARLFCEKNSNPRIITEDMLTVMKGCLEKEVNPYSIIDFMGKLGDHLQLRKLIKTSPHAFWYCKNVLDCKEVRERITESNDAYFYCYEIKDIPSVRSYITSSMSARRYCEEVKDRPEIRKYITDSQDACIYCKNVQDLPEIRKYITDPRDAYDYCKWLIKPFREGAFGGSRNGGRRVNIRINTSLRNLTDELSVLYLKSFPEESTCSKIQQISKFITDESLIVDLCIVAKEMKDDNKTVMDYLKTRLKDQMFLHRYYIEVEKDTYIRNKDTYIRNKIKVPMLGCSCDICMEKRAEVGYSGDIVCKCEGLDETDVDFICDVSSTTEDLTLISDSTGHQEYVTIEQLNQALKDNDKKSLWGKFIKLVFK